MFQAMQRVDPAGAAPPGGGVSREQLLVFLADVFRGTAEERAPLVMAMARGEGGATVTANQVREVSGGQRRFDQSVTGIFPSHSSFQDGRVGALALTGADSGRRVTEAQACVSKE